MSLKAFLRHIYVSVMPVTELVIITGPDSALDEFFDGGDLSLSL